MPHKPDYWIGLARDAILWSQKFIEDYLPEPPNLEGSARWKQIANADLGTIMALGQTFGDGELGRIIEEARRMEEEENAQTLSPQTSRPI